MTGHREGIRCGVVGDEGSASVELAVVTPAILVVLLLAIAAGRVTSANEALDHVATAAARAASLARTPGAARSAAIATADGVLHERSVHCRQTTVDVDTSGLGAALGQPGTVHVDVACAVPLADLSLPGMPGTVRLRSAFASPTDPYRGRQ